MMYYRAPVASANSSDSSSSSITWGWHHDYVASSPRQISSEALERIVKVVSRSAVVVFSRSSCCMCHAAKRLLCGMGVNPTVYELDQDPEFLGGKEIERALLNLLGHDYSKSTGSVVPVVFIGGKLVGGMDGVMASLINGTLVPLLKEAGALWL